MNDKLIFLILIFFCLGTNAQEVDLSSYNVIWNSQSKKSSESMPCGGGDIGLNVWVEDDDILFYIARSGAFDENNTLLKQGRVRLYISPNPFVGGTFKQELKLKEGYVLIEGKNKEADVKVKIWVNVFRPIVNVEVLAEKPVSIRAAYENWRFKDRITVGKENNANSYKWAPPGEVVTKADIVNYEGKDEVLFYHQNDDSTVFVVAVNQQGLDAVKSQLSNPLANLRFGGLMVGGNMRTIDVTRGKYQDTEYKGWQLISKRTAKKHQIKIYLHSGQHESLETWRSGLAKTIAESKNEYNEEEEQHAAWWKKFWDRSYIFIKPQNRDVNDIDWQMGRNYQLFRYMLACNAYGTYPTKFNGGLFTYDPSGVDTAMKYTPDFRNWGGGTHTAQNQRLVYWPLLRSGDYDLMKPQFEFYRRLLNNAKLRSETYWKHGGACFTEQLENFGLPNPAEYGWKRPASYDKGMEYNAWLEYEWDTVLEFCMMILEKHQYNGDDIKVYLPMIESCLQFFDEHYQYLAKQRGSKALDSEGHLVLYPGSAAETYKMAYNANSTIAALKTVLTRLLALPASYLDEEQKERWKAVLNRMPPLSFRTLGAFTLLAPAKHWERINNTEAPQLYPVFPWGIYGLGKPGLDTAVNTYQRDPDLLKFRSHIGWKQDNIFAARLGLTREALALNRLKLKDSGRRFPAFWGPGFDWTPDHNWGGSGMIGLQEMLLQTDGTKIYILPSWPMDCNVEFKLHAPFKTTVHVKVSDGKIQFVDVFPKSRTKDIIMPTN